MYAYFAILVGIAAGFLYAVSGFRDTGKSQTLKDNARVKNLVYVAAALPTTLVADLGKLPGADASLPLTLYYVGSAIASALVSIFAIAATIVLMDGRLVKRDGRYGSIQPSALALVYIHSGFEAYRSVKADEIAKAQTRVIPFHEALWNFNILLLGEKQYLAAPSPAAKGFVIHQILAAISTLAQGSMAHLPNVKIASNYMLCVDPATATAQQLELLKFNVGTHDDCSSLLVLMTYEAGVTAPRISLPIRKSRDYVLPGAPEAFDSHQAQVMSRRVSFPTRSKIPKPVQDEIRADFEKVKFESFLSLPLVKGDSCVGIVNIESRDGDAFASPADVDRLVRALQPHCTLLTYML